MYQRFWIIENGFRIMKTDFDARPVYVRRDDRIKAHFLTGFLTLLIYKYLEKKVNRAGKHFTTEEIVTRQKMRSIIAQTKKREKDEDDDK